MLREPLCKVWNVTHISYIFSLCIPDFHLCVCIENKCIYTHLCVCIKCFFIFIDTHLTVIYSIWGLNLVHITQDNTQSPTKKKKLCWT